MPTDRHRSVLKEAKTIRFKLFSLSAVKSNKSLKSSSPHKHSLRRLPVFIACLTLIALLPLAIMAALALANPAGDIAAKQSQAGSVKSEIDRLNMQMEAKVESYNAANVQLAKIQGSIQENQQKLTRASQTLSVTQSRLNDRVTSIYRNGNVGMLDVLMDTSNLNDFLSTYDMLSKLSEQDRNDVEQIKMLKSQIEAEQSKLDSDKSSQESLVSQLASDKNDIEASINVRQQKLASINTDITTLQQQEQQQAEANQAALQQQLQQQAAATYNSDSGSSSGGGGGGSSAPPAPHAGGVVGIAMQYLGVPYVWGGASPSGFDCSGLVMYVYRQVGISLPHSAAAQYSAGTPISYNQLSPGDLVFFGYGSIEHVGIYIGGGRMIHAPYPGTVVQISPISGGGSYRGACRL